MTGTRATADTVTDDMGWRQRARCGGASAHLFIVDQRETKRQRQHREAMAKALCLSCPVRERCLRYALDVDEEQGIWGGLSPAERETLKSSDAPDWARRSA
ncbi:WhiB family transcriptional regulator [Gordonia sp. CPCC 206044]|uniref:WhiB family transcriptional regulator n=1 Tax=Gordonia sp. CPCC 206044 TaxID=3140793 RepID=UPI003AF3CCA3